MEGQDEGVDTRFSARADDGGDAHGSWDSVGSWDRKHVHVHARALGQFDPLRRKEF